MDINLIPGIIGGITALMVIGYVSLKIRNKPSHGQLKFGLLVLSTGWACFALVVFATYGFFFDESVQNDPVQLYANIGIFFGFLIGMIYSFGEYYGVHGSYDKEGIVFNTPWTGRKEEKWKEIISIKFNSQANWYVLKFKSGKKIRLSNLLYGTHEVLYLLKKM